MNSKFPAFPFEMFADFEGDRGKGMTLRDYFAAKAMQGMLTTNEGIRYPMDNVSTRAYAQADSMLKAREQ